MSLEGELSAYIAEIQRVAMAKCPSWLTPNSHFYGVRPGHDLDLLEISFDFRIERYAVFQRGATPDLLKDPSKPDLKAVKGQE